MLHIGSEDFEQMFETVSSHMIEGNWGMRNYYDVDGSGGCFQNQPQNFYQYLLTKDESAFSRKSRRFLMENILSKPDKQMQYWRRID